eukprot:Tamp_09445.p1 GENE.Tamp_09445~~Tamp_09445.p1  ORF type:complete len:613 (-),score=108.15 Tamp_09445:336-1919(-)
MLPENGAGGGAHIPQHLQVLQRLSAASTSPNRSPPGQQRPRVRTTVDDLAEKISATNFVLAGGPLEKYTNGGKGKPHKKFFRMLPDKKLNYDGKSVGPVLSVLNGCGPIVQEHHKVSADTAARSFRVVCEGGVSLLLIAPSAEEKTKWMEGIEIMLIGGYKRKKETISDPLGLSAADQAVSRPASEAPRVETHEGLGLPSVRNEATHWRAQQQPVAPAVNGQSANAPTGGVRRPESGTRGGVSSGAPAPIPAPARATGEVMDGEARRAPRVVAPAEMPQEAAPEPVHKRAPQGVKIQAAPSQPPAPAPVPEPQMPAAAPEAGDGAKPRKLSVLQMANNFAQHAEQSSSPAPPAAPTIKWLSTDKVLKLNGNTVTKSSPASPPPAEEYGVAVANVMLSSGVHEWEVEVGGKGLHWCGIGVATPDVPTGNSLRRPESRGRAWFYHSKGFLCDGNEFLGDWESTPTFGAGDRIGVRVDLARKSLVFTANGKRVPGEISGVVSKVVPVLYMDNLGGQSASCTFVSLPAPAK